MRVTRFEHNPIIRPEMLPGPDGENINGPSLVRMPEWVTGRLGAYHLYFAHHHGTYIRLAHADRLEGPWTVHAPGTLRLDQAVGCVHHIASPDVHVDDDRREIRMYFHGPSADTATHRQRTFVATSSDGIDFTSTGEILGNPYWRAFRHDGWWYAMVQHGRLYRSRDGLTAFEAGPSPFPGRTLRSKVARRVRRRGPRYTTPSRHVAVDATDDGLWVYFTDIGDAPERIRRSFCPTPADWAKWKTSRPIDVLRPEHDWEGADLGVRASIAGEAQGPEHALRDPAIFVEDGRRYLLYSVAGESGIALAELHE
ncbi:MAG TPA: hypothetical protein VGN51_20645 [Acidimicrobiia bacterium]